MQFAARRYDTHQPVTLTIAEGRVAGVELYRGAAPVENLPWVAPGLIDLQVNGYGGQEFNDPALTIEQVAQISRAMDGDGVTGYCPTCTTHGFELLSHAMNVIAAACEQIPDVAQRVIGIHLEGPYISPEDGPRGAHPKQFVRPPDWDEFQRLQAAARCRIRLLTLSPEYDGAAAFIAKVAASGVLVAIGHTSADSDQIRAAVDAGARMSTHLGNGAHAQIRRHPNYLWDQLADDRLSASLIADGHHLPPAVVKCFVRMKTPTRCLLVSDITGLGGMPTGRYDRSGLGAVEVLDDGRLVIAGQRQLLAGAALPLTVGVPNLMRFAELDLATAIACASQHPAELIGCPRGGIEPGSRADLILFELPGADGRQSSGPMRVTATFQAGELVFGQCS